MPRKSARENGGFRRTGWKAKLAKREADEKRIVKNIYIGASNARRWIILKKKLEYRSDVDFVAYLLNLAEPFSGKGKLEGKDKEDNDGKNNPITRVPDINVEEEDHPESQEKEVARVEFNEVEGEVAVSDEIKGVEEEEVGNAIDEERGGKGDNEEDEEEEDEEEEDEDEDDEDDDDDDDGSGGEWTGGRQPLRRSLRSLPTNKGTKMSVRRSARNVRREEEEEEEEEEGEEEKGEGVGGELGGVRRRKRGDRSQRRQRRRERKKRRRRKRLKGSGGESTEEDEEDSEMESEAEAELLRGEEVGLRSEEGVLGVVGAPTSEEHPVIEQVDPPMLPEPPKKGRRGRKKKVVVPEAAVVEGIEEKVERETENGVGLVVVEAPPVDAIENTPREPDSMTHLEEPALVVDPESDRVSKHHRHHRRKSRKSKDGMDEDGMEDEAEGEEEGGEMGEVGTGRRKKRRKRGRARREEECGGEEGEGMVEDQGEENFPRYEVVDGVSEEGEANHQEKAPLPMQSTSQEEGVLIEVGERVKLKRRRKRRHSRGEDGDAGENEGVNGDAASSEDPLSILRKVTKHKKRKHGHGEGHGNRRKHHDVRKVPVDGILSEPSPVTAPNLHPEGSPEPTGSIPDPPTTPNSNTPPSAPAVNKGADNKQRVAIRITLCGECDSRHVLDACPLKRPLTIIHDSVVLRNNVGDEQTKDEIAAEGASLGDTDTKSFATEEEEELADGEETTQDTTCKNKKKVNEDADTEDAVIPAGGIKDPDERRRQRNGLSEGMEERMPVPNGKYRPGTERVSTIAQDAVKQVDGENGDASTEEGKGVKDESGVDENKLDTQEEMLANGDASTTSNSTSASKPMHVDADDLESANETCTSQPSPMPAPEPISTADTTVGGGNSANGGKTFAEASLPMALKLETREAGHGPGVTAKRPIARFTQFGPLLGRKIREMDIPDDFGMRHIWEVVGASGRFLISTEDPTTSNWLRFIRPAPTREQRNVAPVTRGDRLYFVTTAPLQVGEELLYWPDESSGAGAPSGAAQPSSAQGPNSSSNASSTSSTSSSGAGWAKKKMEKTNCGGCNLRFGHPLYYRLHCSVFHDPNFSLTIRKYHCKVCGAAVLGKENIMRHAAENHDGKGAYQCQFCKKFFLRLNYLEMHRTYGCAANPQRTRPLCDFCGRKFCQPQKLKVHIKRMHSDMADVLREFQCKLCLKLLGSRAALQRHMKEVHHRDVVGACACDRCGKTFQNKSNLKIHMLTHSGVKPFRCREGNCPAAFTTKQCLQFHYKKVHGYGEDNMPVIERCVAYTFDAYSGGTVEDPGRGKVPLFSSNRLEKDQEDSNASNPAPDSEAGEDESESVGGRSLSPQRGRKEQGEGRREKGGGKGRGRRPGRPVGRTNGPREVKEGMTPKPALEGDGLVEAMVPSILPEEILPPPDTDVLPPPPPVIPSLPDVPECKEAILGNMADSQPPPLTPQPGPLPTEVAPQTPTLEAYNGGQTALGAPPPSMGPYADHSRLSYPGKIVSKGSKKWMGDGSVPMRPSLEAEMEEEDEEDDEEDDEEEEEDDGVGKRVGDEGVVGEAQVVGDVYGTFPDDSRFVPVAEDGEEGFRRPEESNASLLVEAALDAAERDMSGVVVTEDDTKPHQEAEAGGGYLTSPPRANGPERHMDEDDHQRILHHPQPSHHAHHHLQHHHHLSLHHHQLPHPHHPHHPHVHHHLPPASHLHVQGGALMLHHPHHHHPTHHAVMHQEEDEEEERMGPGSEAASVGTIVERIVNTSLAEEEEGDVRDEVPHPSVRTMHLLHPDAYAPDPHGRLPPAGSLPSPRNMTLLGMKAAVKVEEELHMAAMQQQQREEEEEGLDMSYKHSAAHYGRAVSGMAHHMQEEEEATQGVGGVGDPSADDLQDFRVLRSPPVDGRFEQSQQGLDMSRGSFPFALPAARCFPLYEGSTSAADVARSVDLRRAGLAYTSPPLPPYSQSLDLTPMRTRHSVDLSLPRALVGADGVGPPQGGGGQSPPPPPSPMHRHLCHAPPASPHHHVHHHHGVDPLGCVVGGDDGGEGGSGGLSPPPAAYQPGAYLHAPPSYHRQPPQHPPSPPPSPYHPQARTAPHMPPPPSASPSPYHHYSGYY